MKSNVVCVVALLSMAAVILGEAWVANAVTCNVMELSPCGDAIRTAAPPSKACCDKLKEQQPCLCIYIKDPKFSGYVNSPNSKKIEIACGTPKPKC
ncbi:hypothetical protein Vadar_007865 [Vaccinium darrowii]|uniref:Uncharacterized protein n=1 Tax=Vaccinium darrowii TaxID=229202 RepID=A0ACB7YDF5_9ERIC|nr:hypothetical protein Vadar_007865 [Vaccinium darrowii]